MLIMAIFRIRIPYLHSANIHRHLNSMHHPSVRTKDIALLQLAKCEAKQNLDHKMKVCSILKGSVMQTFEAPLEQVVACDLAEWLLTAMVGIFTSRWILFIVDPFLGTKRDSNQKEDRLAFRCS